ncbi:MAG: V-type ATP synthase subunit I [Thermodesulfobacteriota bacterium]|nr:MAG: V-type ATP synthase subunit I [Thermodesulfobacteriota bacterium]
MIEKMTKIQIIGPKGLVDGCIRTLHAVAVVHIETVPAEIGIEDTFFKRLPIEKEKLREKEFLEKASVALKNLLLLLPRPEGCEREGVGAGDIKKVYAGAMRVGGRVRALNAEIDGLKEELTLIGKYERLLRGFAPLVPRLGGLKNFEVTGLTIEKTREDVPGLLSDEISRITGGVYEIFVEELDARTTGVVIAYPKKNAAPVRQLLSGKSISEIKLPEEYKDMTLIDALKRMERRKAAIPGLIKEAQREIEEISRAWYGRFVGLKCAVDDAIEEIGVLSYAAETRFAFIIEGWVPTRKFPALQEKFRETFGDRVMVRELEIDEREVESIPVHIRNPKILRPFEVFMSALPPPKYGSVDPTPYIAIFFPVFFGLIVGDIGYGVVIFIVGLVLRRRLRKKEVLGDIATVLMVSSLMAVVFGLLFGEMFGDLGERLGILHPLILNRVEALKTFMVLTLGIGLGHVVLGLVIGTTNRFLRGRKKEGWSKVITLLLLAVLLAVVAAVYGYLPGEFMRPGIVALVVLFVLLVVLEGIVGPLEFIRALGNILSYIRIMAVGTASVVLALVANRIGGMSDDLIIGIVVAGLIHSLNIILSVVSPSIQAMRLQYVEFMGKFYEGGDRRYRPFKKR